jgi:hypothetical protein
MSFRRASASIASLVLLAALSVPARATDPADRWAVVNANGTLARGFGVKSVAKLGTGGYRITFEAKSIAKCGYLVTMGPAATGQSAPSGYWHMERPPSLPGSKNILDIFTFSASVGGSLPTFANRPFHLYVVCH